MTVGKMLDYFFKEYEFAKKEKSVIKPISYSLYRTWKWCDIREKNRNQEGGAE